MPTVEAKGKTFEFPDNVTEQQIGQALDEYFSMQADNEIPKPEQAQASTPEQMVAPQAVPEEIPTAQPYQMRTQEQPSFGYQTRPDQPSAVPEEGSLTQDVLGGAEVGASMISNIVAQPVAGLRGIAELATGGDLASATQAIEETQQALTYEPKTERGQEYQQKVADLLSPIGEAIEVTGEELGDATREATGSWVLGGLAESIPEAVLELAGVKGAGRIVKPKNVVEPKTMAALSQSAPTIKQLRENASALYKEIDNSGVVVPKSDYLNLGIKLNNIARRSGYDPNLTPKVKGFLDRLESDYQKGELKITDIDQLRKVAQVPANAIENATEAAIGSKIIQGIDDFLDEQGANLAKNYGPDIGQKYRDARSLTARVKKAEVLDEAVFRATEAASGFENGLRNEIRTILKNKKKRRGFTPDEIKAMQQITQGGSMENLFKKLGKLGFGSDQQTNMLLGSLGFAGGLSVGGPLGAAAVPTIGYVSANIAKKLGQKNAAFLGDITRAGKNGEQVVEAYIKNVPKNLQRPEELSALLADPSVDAATIQNLANRYKKNKQLIEDAAFLTNKLRQAQLTGALAAQLPAQEGEQPNEQ